MAALRDKTELGFRHFADAASFCGRGTPTAALQRMSPKQASNGAKMIRTDTALSRQLDQKMIMQTKPYFAAITPTAAYQVWPNRSAARKRSITILHYSSA